MALLFPLRYYTLRGASAVPLHRRRAHLVGVLWLAGLAAYNNCGAQSFRRSPFLRSKFVSEFSSEGPSFTAMEAASSTVPTNVEAASNTVPTIVVYVTVPSKEAGKKLSESIIKERLAACVNRVPGIESVYWWEGKVQTDSEELLIIKTREALLDALTEHVKSNHEYEVPEVIALPINGGNLKYLEWIKNNTREN